MKKRNTVIAVTMALLLAGGVTAGAMGFGGMKNGMGFMNHNHTETEVETVDTASKHKEILDAMLESGKITEEQYNEYIANLENGNGFGGMRGSRMHMSRNMDMHGMNKGMHGMPFMGGNCENMRMPEGFEKPAMPEMTEEQKAEMLEKAKEQLATMLEEGKITQEQYDEYLAKLESGEMVRLFSGDFRGKNMNVENNRPEKADKPVKFDKPAKDDADTETEATDEADATVKAEKGNRKPAGNRGASRGNGFGAMNKSAKKR